MKEEHLNVKTKRRRGYSSYLGEQYPVPENIMNRDFKTDRYYQKRLNDITEFTILYLMERCIYQLLRIATTMKS